MVGRLHAVKDRLTASDIELDRINAELEPLLPTAELENEYASVDEYKHHAIRVLAELRYKIEHLEIARRNPVSSTTASLQSAYESIAPLSSPILPKLSSKLCAAMSWQVTGMVTVSVTHSLSFN